MNQKPNKGEIAVTDIDKNKGLLDETYLSDDLKQQMAGDTPIHETPEDWSVTLKKTAFSKPRKNLFDSNAVSKGYVLTDTGALYPQSNQDTSEYITVRPNNYYSFSNVQRVVFYDANKNFIDFHQPTPSEPSLLSPENAVYMRVSSANSNLNTLQVESGEISTPYEPNTLLVENKYIEKNPISIDEVDFK